MIENICIYNKNGDIIYGDPSLLKKNDQNYTEYTENGYTVKAKHSYMNKYLVNTILKSFISHLKLTKSQNFINLLTKMENTYGCLFLEKSKKYSEIKIDVVENFYCILNNRGRVFKSEIVGKIKITGVEKYTKIVIQKPNFKMIYLTDLIINEGLSELKAELEASNHEIPFKYVVNMEPPLKLIKMAFNKYALDVRDTRIENLEIEIPILTNARNVNPKVDYGMVDVFLDHVVWKIPKITFKRAIIELICDLYDDMDRNINIRFKTEFYSASGIKIKEVKSSEKKDVWVRYLFQSGNYEIRKVYNDQ